MTINDSTPVDSRPTTEDVMDSLTGFDEIAIEKNFGKEILVLAEHHQTKFMRALVFVLKRREGLDDVSARTAALELSLADTKETFADPEPEIDEDDPDTDQGKGVSSSAVERIDSRTSA